MIVSIIYIPVSSNYSLNNNNIKARIDKSADVGYMMIGTKRSIT